MRTFDDMLSKQLTDEEFKKEYDAIQPEMDVIRAIVDARTSQNLTQKDLRMEQEILRLIYLKGWQMEWEWLLRLSLYLSRKYDSKSVIWYSYLEICVLVRVFFDL